MKYNLSITQKNLVLFCLIIAVIFIKLDIMAPNDRFFILGRDPIRHVSLSENIVNTGQLGYPKTQAGDYTAYIYYPLFYHTLSAVLSGITAVNITTSYIMLSFIMMLLFFIIFYNILGSLSFKKYRLIVCSIAVFSLPVPEPSPHSLAYFVLYPLLIYLSIRYFQKTDKMYLLCIGIASMMLSVTHSASALYFAGIITIFLVLGLFLGKRKNHIKYANLWFASIFSWVVGYLFLYAPLVPTFWETFIHYWIVIDMVPPGIRTFIQFMTTSHEILSKLFLLFLPGLIYLALRTLIKLNITYNFNRVSKYLSMFGFIILIFGIISLGYILIINLLLSLFQLIATGIEPQLPYFAMKILIEKMPSYLLYVLPANNFYVSLANPTNLMLVIFLFLSALRLIKRYEFKGGTYSSETILLASFFVPLFVSILFSATNNAFFNSDIPARFINYAYAPMFTFSGYYVIKHLLPRKSLTVIFVLFLLFSSTYGMRFVSDYGVDIIQDKGYRWLVDSTELVPNLKEMNYDVSGYYHISSFPTEYKFNLFYIVSGEIMLNNTAGAYTPAVDVSIFSYRIKKDFGDIKWSSHSIGSYDDKIYTNPSISFYKTSDAK